MIELSGRAFSRAWLAVQLAASDDDARPVLYRAVHIEEYPDGVRLIATDSYWLAMCWVGCGAFDDEPPVIREPVATVTVADTEWRVRDLMRHVAKLTKKEEAIDIPVRLDLATSLYDEDTPTLSPELARSAHGSSCPAGNAPWPAPSRPTTRAGGSCSLRTSTAPRPGSRRPCSPIGCLTGSLGSRASSARLTSS